MDKSADYTHPKWMNYLAIPAALMLALVFTNDLHKQVFQFHKGIELYDTQYQYGIPYYILMAWFILGGLWFVVMLLIVDEDFQPHYVSGGALPLSEADIAKTQTGAVHQENTLLRSAPIHAGRVVWQDDITV